VPRSGNANWCENRAKPEGMVIALADQWQKIVMSQPSVITSDRMPTSA
jgi:hypothetical protein